MDLCGKVVLVTGGAGGIGKSYSRRLVDAGANVSVCDINSVEGEKLVNEINNEKHDRSAIFLHCDVTNEKEFRECFEETITEFGRLDIVINNAGILDDSPDGWKTEIRTNINGAIYGTILAIHFLGKQFGNSGGSVIMTSSKAGVHRDSLFPIYSATKGALNYFTKSIGSPANFNISGVRVMSICPGLTDTGITKYLDSAYTMYPTSQNAHMAAERKANTHAQRPESVAECLIDILSNGVSGSVWLVEDDSWREVVYPKV